MKLCSFGRPDGSTGHGLVRDDDRLVELGDGDLLTVVAGGALGTPRRTWESSQLRMLAPLRPGKILAAATNYHGHVAEGGGQPIDPTRTVPKLFLKPDTCLAGPGDPFVVPAISPDVDWEVELGVVIGSTSKDVPVADALERVFGFVTCNDISLRSMHPGIEREQNASTAFFDWLDGKWADGAAPIGPWLVTRDEVDVAELRLRCWVNDECVQDSTPGDMIHSVAELVSYASRLCTLLPGDLIMTGTPAGVGAASGRRLHPGDLLTSEVTGLGRLQTPIVGEPA